MDNFFGILETLRHRSENLIDFIYKYEKKRNVEFYLRFLHEPFITRTELNKIMVVLVVMEAKKSSPAPFYVDL